MKLNRRELIVGSAAAGVSMSLLPEYAEAWRKGDARGWHTDFVGAGGLCDGFDIAPDGTVIARTDSSFLYFFSGKLPTDFFNQKCAWYNIVNAQSMPGTMRAPGIVEAVIAYSKTSNFYMMAFNNLDVSSISENAWFLYYTKNYGGRWVESNLTWLAPGAIFHDGTIDVQSSDRKASTRKMIVDPVNENVVWAGLPPNTATGNMAVSSGTLVSTGTVVSICDLSGIVITNQHLWSGPGGTDYGIISSPSTQQTSSAMTWAISGTTLTIGGTSPANFVGSAGLGLTSTAAALVAGTIITAVLGGNQYTVNNSQTVSGSGNTLIGNKATLSVSRSLAVAAMNLTGSAASNGNISSVYLATDGVTFNPVSIASLPQTKMLITSSARCVGVTCMMYDKHSGTVVGVGGKTVTKRMLMSIQGADVYETLDGGVTWNPTGLSTALGTSSIFGFHACMNFKGWYFITVTAVTTTTIWRYSDVVTPGVWAWAQLTQAAALLDPVSHVPIYCDPRSGHESYLSFSGTGGGGRGLTSNNADNATGSAVTFGSTANDGTPFEFAASYDVPWLNSGLANVQGTFIGLNWAYIDDAGYYWWCGNQGIVWLGTLVDHVTPAIPDWSVSRTTYSVSLSRGVENTIAEFVLCPPGAPYPIKCVQDMGAHTNAVDAYGTDYYMNGPATAASPVGQAGRVQRTDAWSASYAPGNPAFVALKEDCTSLGSVQQGMTGYSLDYGQTFTPYPLSPEKAWFNLTGGANEYCNGGAICTVDDQRQFCCTSAVNRGVVPVYTANRGTTWALCVGLPPVDWCGRYFGHGSDPAGQPFAAGQGARIGQAWALDVRSVSGSFRIHHSLDGGANWGIQSTTGSFGIGGDFETGTILLSVPDHDDDLWVSAAFSTSTNSGIWRSTDGGDTFNKLTLPSNVTTGGRYPQYFALGAPLPGKSYPTLYLAAWTATPDFMTTKIFYSDDIGVTWTILGKTGTFLDLPPTMACTGVKAIFGNWNIPGMLHASSYGSGFGYHRLL